MDSAQAKWQPVMLIATHRLECSVCGALAIFIALEDEGDDWDYEAWCQDCFRTAQEDEEEQEGGHDAPPSHDAA